MSSFERAETIAFMVTAAAIVVALLITGIFWIRRRVEESRMDEMDDERVAHRMAEDDEL